MLDAQPPKRLAARLALDMADITATAYASDMPHRVPLLAALTPRAAAAGPLASPSVNTADDYEARYGCGSCRLLI